MEKTFFKKKEKEITPAIIEELEVSDLEEEEAFQSFFLDVLKQFPQKTANIISNTYEQSKEKAGNIVDKGKDQLNEVFEEFLAGADEEVRKKAHRIIHSASLTAAIIGCSPIPFSDAALLVPVQITMMARLHKAFGQSWTKSLAKSMSKELVVVGIGRSAVGNIMKLVPAVGTVAGAAVNATVASVITEALGWVTVKMLNDGEDLFDHLTSFRGQVKTLFKTLKGKKGFDA